MTTVQVELPGELLQAARISAGEVSKLLALELFREDAVSLGRAAELCGVPLAEFIDFAAERAVPLHYSLEDFDQDQQLIERLLSSPSQ
jgi:predicted HTH domain antitoxin